MVVDEWVVAVVLCLSALVIGNVAQKAVDIIILRRTSAAFDVAQAVQVQRLWLILVILLQWTLPRITVWVPVRWQALQDPAPLHQLLASDPVEVMVVNTSGAHKAPMLSHQASVHQLAHIQDLSTPTSAQLEVPTPPALLIAVLRKLRSNLPAMDPLLLDHQTTFTPTKLRATLSLSSLQALAI